MPPLPGERSGVFTTARPSVMAAVREHFDLRAEPVQPVEFPHNIHIEKGLKCTDFCHATVTKGPRAGLPSVKTCMMCHAALATDKPRIQQITAAAARGEDLAWQRVYGFVPQQHVRYQHAPHIRAGIDCTKCHGDVANQTVARRNVNHTMGFCVTCHRENNAPDDCLTCHN
ncbi:MAG: cytochrome c3 family protein [Acidobacteria bacterium]|nr:cytochrome c3 family protein [Acidobacteriota bacterium]